MFLKISPKRIPTILAFGKFIANGLTNLIPKTAEIAGTLRTFDETWRDEAHQIIHKTAAQISQQSGASCSVIINKGYPVLINDSETTERVKKYAISLLGAEHVLSIPERMTAEDFAYFLQKKPGVFYRLGTSNNIKGITNQLHTSRFDIDEQALKVGMMMLSWIALNELKIK
jgi:amidohydrolase